MYYKKTITYKQNYANKFNHKLSYDDMMISCRNFYFVMQTHWCLYKQPKIQTASILLRELVNTSKTLHLFKQKYVSANICVHILYFVSRATFTYMWSCLGQVHFVPFINILTLIQMFCYFRSLKVPANKLSSGKLCNISNLGSDDIHLFVGAGADGVEGIKRHQFFSTIDWNVSFSFFHHRHSTETNTHKKILTLLLLERCVPFVLPVETLPQRDSASFQTGRRTIWRYVLFWSGVHS